MMENMRELSMDEMDKASGGAGGGNQIIWQRKRPHDLELTRTFEMIWNRGGS